MAVREAIRERGKKLREELRGTGRVVLHAPVLLRGAECAIRFLLGAILSFGRVLGDASPFGLALVASSGSGAGGLAALLGFTLGTLSVRGFTEGLRYAAAAILIFSVSFAFYDLKVYKKSWFMPVMAAALSGCTGFVYLSAGGWNVTSAVMFAGELVLTAAATYFYRIAFSAWKKEDHGERTARQTVSALIVGVTVLIALAGVPLPGGLSAGRLCAMLCVMAGAYLGGAPVGATAGICCGIAMDLSGGGAPFCSMIYTFAGLLSGVFWKQGKLFSVLAYVVGSATAVLWTWGAGVGMLPLYECFIASVLFFMLPERLLRKVGVVLAHEAPPEISRRAGAFVRQRLEKTAEAFQELSTSLKASLPNKKQNDGDAAEVFDRSAERVCKSCALRDACWQRGYTATYAALNDALPTMLARGRGLATDFPDYFRTRCIKFPTFLEHCNEEVSALLLRRQYESRLGESRCAVCRQYGVVADIFSRAATDDEEDFGAEKYRHPNFSVTVGLALRQKTGETVSGDGATFFQREDGTLFVLLCDGMGSGEGANGESTLAIRLLERFLRAGVAPEAALGTLNSALALRCEEEGGFSTVDLLSLNLLTGEGQVYKYGAAPTYLIRGDSLRRMSGSSLPAGLLTGEGTAPDKCLFAARRGDCLALLSDGVTDEEDGWLRDTLRRCGETSPQMLAELLVNHDKQALDDQTAVVICIAT